MSNNIKEKSGCSGCSACFIVCPVGAIEYKLNDDGFYEAFVDNEKCVNCGKCKKVCTKFDDELEKANNIENGVIYSAQSNDENVIKTCTSGGIAYEIAKYGIENGYSIVGVVYNYSENKAQTIIAKTIKDLDAIKGSKYIQSDVHKAFKDVIKEAKEDEDKKYIIFGTPCQIAGIKKVIEIEKINNDINACFPIDGNGERNIVAKLKKQLANFRDEENKTLTSISSSIKAIDISGVARIEEQISKFDADKNLTEIEKLDRDLNVLKTHILQLLQQKAKEEDLSKREGILQKEEERVQKKDKDLDGLIRAAEVKVKTDCDSSKIQALEEARNKYRKDLEEQQNKNNEVLKELQRRISGLSQLLKGSKELFENLKKITEVVNENGILKGQLESIAKEKKDGEKKLEKYEQDLKDEQKKCTILQKERESQEKTYEKEIELRDSELQKLKDDSEKLTSDKNKYFEANLKLNKELENKVQKLSQASSAALEASKREETANQKLAVAEKALLNEQTQKENLAKSLASSENKVKELTGEIEGKEQKLAELQKAIYPSEFNTDEKFAPLKAHLEAWLSEKIPAAETVKSSLGLFAQRAALGEDIWQQALRSISIGITQTLQAKGASASEVFDELMRWNTYLMSFSDEEFQFSLKVPAIGASVDLSWMSVKTKGATRVSRILAWAVYNQYGVAHNAEVE